MAFVIGTDEAGYGPNLGPLTITATRWQCPTANTALYEELAEIFSKTKKKDRLILADSKVAYKSGGSLKQLETTVLATLGLVNRQIPANWRQLLSLTCGQSAVHLANECAWLSQANLPLPVRANESEIQEWAAKMRPVLLRKGISLQAVKSVHVLPSAFNAGLTQHGNKASLLTFKTLQLAKTLWPSGKTSCDRSTLYREPVRLICDKHGGRSKYQPVIGEHLQRDGVTICCEGRDSSEYEWSNDSQSCAAQFISNGERHLPVALASMVSKYLREVTMILWNRFWQGHIAELKPTKGYPLDAKRFMRDIEPMRDSLGIKRDEIWRMR